MQALGSVAKAQDSFSSSVTISTSSHEQAASQDLFLPFIVNSISLKPFFWEERSFDVRAPHSVRVTG